MRIGDVTFEGISDGSLQVPQTRLKEATTDQG